MFCTHKEIVQSLSQVFAIIYYIADDSGISEDHVCFEMIQKIIALMNLKVFPSSVQIMSPVSEMVDFSILWCSIDYSVLIRFERVQSLCSIIQLINED